MCTGLFYHGNVGQHVAGFNPPCFSSLGYIWVYIWMIRSVLRCFKKNLARNILDGLIYQDGQ